MMRRLLRKLFGRKHYKGGTITYTAPNDSAGPYKLTKAQGVYLRNGELIYWVEK